MNEAIYWERISARRARKVARTLRGLGYYVTITQCRARTFADLAVYLEPMDTHRCGFICRVALEAAGLVPRSRG